MSRRATMHGLLVAAALLAVAGPAHASGTVDVNTASEKALTTLPGIGPVKARAIIAYRKAHGPFHSVDELRRVKGIGKMTVAGLRHRVCFGDAATADDTGGGARAADDSGGGGSADRGSGGGGDFDLDLTEPGGSDARGSDDARGSTGTRSGHHRRRRHHSSARSAPPPTDTPAGKININTAESKELQKLPGIGPAKARAIITQRTAAGPFHAVSELVRVPGIGKKTLEKLRPWITVRVDLNTADLQQLEAIGLDTGSAERLLAWRAHHGRFHSVGDLTRVPGFGKGALETLKPLVWAGPR